MIPAAPESSRINAQDCFYRHLRPHPRAFAKMTGRASPWASRFARAHTSAAHILRIRTPRPFFRTQASRATPRRQKIATRVKRPKTLATYCHLDVRHMHQDPHAQERRRRRPANGQHEISSREISSTSQALLPSPPSSTSATSSPKPQSYMYTPWPSDAAFPRKGPPSTCCLTTQCSGVHTHTHRMDVTRTGCPQVQLSHLHPRRDWPQLPPPCPRATQTGYHQPSYQAASRRD